ncbi:Golgi reassembly-stacking protein 2 isoform X1 [Acyrthosiphon pisum]|uniref:PDZ GRASP-type domain-containing protein n=1 Tax=Acyrthosiphon pisum TaxID=7029 RepID=A0A8R2A6S7_ACYPI|nr:Golgi reassembly-stacking protein 2 isoform X1 [Acyrthosiphon pisum]|eukprot:XP_001943457.1 PREDICTED: Golgi reassembly-stacking protein 2 isoform X1 [Acyrthosiphon pisum]
MGSANSTPIPGGGTEGYHVLKVQDNSPGQAAGLEAFFDFILAINNTRLDKDNDTLKEMLKNGDGNEITLAVYSSKTQIVREVKIIPNSNWGGQGLLGVSIRFCSFAGANENVWHILDVHPNSPADKAGLRSHTDYIIGSDSIMHESEDLFMLIEAHEGRPLKLYVYNVELDTCREVSITPDTAWPGEGSLGCGIGYGYLHRIPVRQVYQNKDIPAPPVIKPAVVNNVMASAAQIPQVINPPVLTPQPPIISDLPVSVNNSNVEEEKSKEQLPLNESIQPTSTPFFNNTQSETPVSISTDQQIPYSSNSVPSPYFPSQITTFQNPSIPTFQALNSQYSPQQLSSTSDTIKPYVLTPQVTRLPSFTTQEPISISTQEPSITSTSLAQTATAQELNNQSSNVFPPQSSYSQYHPTDIGGATTIADVPNSKDISNYFTQFQTQVSQSNSSSTIPMFSVKNFPQMSPLAQPLGNNYSKMSDSQSQTIPPQPQPGINYSNESSQFQPLQPSQYQPSVYSGMPLTTPISLPGMPPITVSATLPYSAIESLQIDQKKNILNSNS